MRTRTVPQIVADRWPDSDITAFDALAAALYYYGLGRFDHYRYHGRLPDRAGATGVRADLPVDRQASRHDTNHQFGDAALRDGRRAREVLEFAPDAQGAVVRLSVRREPAPGAGRGHVTARRVGGYFKFPSQSGRG